MQTEVFTAALQALEQKDINEKCLNTTGNKTALELFKELYSLQPNNYCYKYMADFCSPGFSEALYLNMWKIEEFFDLLKQDPALSSYDRTLWAQRAMDCLVYAQKAFGLQAQLDTYNYQKNRSAMLTEKAFKDAITRIDRGMIKLEALLLRNRLLLPQANEYLLYVYSEALDLLPLFDFGPFSPHRDTINEHIDNLNMRILKCS